MEILKLTIKCNKFPDNDAKNEGKHYKCHAVFGKQYVLRIGQIEINYCRGKIYSLLDEKGWSLMRGSAVLRSP